MNPLKKQKLKEVLRAMKGESIDFSAFDSAVKELRKSLEEKVAIPTIDMVNSEIEKFRKKIDLTPLTNSLAEIRKTVNTELARLSNELETRLKEQSIAETYAISQSEENTNNLLSAEISGLKVQIASLDMIGSKELAKIEDEISKLDKKTQQSISEIKIPKDREEEIKALEQTLNIVRVDLINRINERGGGSMNRQVLVGGANFLSKYTDYNIKAGSNMTITYVNDDTNKRVNLTFASSGGGGSVGGTVRQIQTVSVSSTIGTLAGTDQVYIANVGIQLVLPTAAGDTNLYTIKNIAASSILILKDGSDTIESDTSLILATQYTSVDLISDGISNWNIT